MRALADRVVCFTTQAFATLSSLFAGDTWVPVRSRFFITSPAQPAKGRPVPLTASCLLLQTTGWAWSECSARPPKEQSAAEAARSAAVVDKTDDTPSLTVVPLADSSDPHGSESSKQWPDAGDTSSSFLEAALMVLCCHAPGGNLSKAAIFINADEGGQQCTFYGSFDSLGGLAALHELDECSAECARSAIRARIGMSQTERDAADALLEDLRAALLDGATDGSPAAAVADVVAEVDACTFAEDPLDEAAIVQTVTRAERRCITGMSASVHSAVGMLLVEAPKQDVTAASLRDLLNGASTDVIALHSSFGHMQRRLEGRLDKLGLGQDAVARLKAQARAAVEEMESASSQAQAVLKRAAGLTIFIMVAGKLKKTLTA